VRTPIIGSRGSDLALWQAHYVNELLGGGSEITVIKTRGDAILHLSLHKVEGKGFFTREIEDALLQGAIDIAVHSYKDLPTEEPEGLRIAGIPPRAPVADMLVRNKSAHDPKERWNLPLGATVGTSSIRRKAQLLHLRPDLKMVDIRGNVPTRLNKVIDSHLDAVILAEAGLSRLGYLNPTHKAHQVASFEPLPLKDACPAAAQGALAIQIRAEDSHTATLVEALTCHTTARAVLTERLLLAKFGGGCHLPLGAHCTGSAGQLTLLGVVTSPDGSQRCVASATGESPETLADEVHKNLLAQGAGDYL